MGKDVSEWLENLGLGKYAEVFAEHEIDFLALPRLNEEDLRELGLPLGARRNLQAAIEKLSEDETRPLATPLSGSTSSGEAERRQLTVMFCDLVEYTELSQQLDPEDLREINLAYQDACKKAIEKHEGYIARYMGDGVLAYFGYPQAHEDDAELAIHAGLGVVQEILNLGETVGNQFEVELSVRVGIATGPVVVGDIIGEAASQESAVVGETPNLAARLQSLAARNTVVIAPETHALVTSRFEYENLGDHNLKGIAEPVPAWRVIAPTTADSRFDAAHPFGLTPLVGREHEIGLLLERWEQAKEGDGQVLLLCGEAGIGKSRITETLRERTTVDNPVSLRYQCSPYHTNSALHPIIEQLERAAQFNAGDNQEVKLDKLESLLELGASDIEAIAPLFALLLSIPFGNRYTLPEMTPDQQKHQTLEALVAQIKGLSLNRPLLLIFEDVHWADPTSLELLEHTIAKVQNIPVLAVINFRPEFSPPWSGHTHVTTLTLNRFTRNLAKTMMDRVAGGKSLPEEVQQQIVERTDGVPLFVEELTKSILESDLLTEEADRYTLSGSLSGLAIPATLQDSLMARLDRLPQGKQIAQVGAAIGREFSRKLLESVCELEQAELDQALDELVDSGLVFRRGSSQNGTCMFKHALVQEVAYASLLKKTRRNLHERIAEALLIQNPGTAESQPELLAHHYTEAGLAEPALQFWLKAGQQSIRHSAYAEAVSHLRRGLSIVEGLPEGEEKNRTEIELRVVLGVSLMGKEGAASPMVGENYRRAQMLCGPFGEDEHLYPVLWGLWYHHFISSELRQACELADRLLEVGQNRNDTELLLEAHHCQWAVRLIGGDLSSALEHCDHGIELYRPDTHHALTFTYGGHDPGVCALNVSGIALWLLGYPEQSKERFDSAKNLAKELAHSRTLADTQGMFLVICSLLRDEDLLEQKAEELLKFAAAQMMLDYQIPAKRLIGWVMFQRGDRQEGLEYMRESLERWLEEGNAWSAVSISLVAESLGQIGEVKEGLKLVEDTLSLVQRHDVHWCEAELYRVKGKLLLNNTTEAPSAAEDAFSRAIKIALEQNAKSLELRAAVDLASLWKSQDKTDRARELLSPVYEWFTEGFDTADLRQAKKLLEELT